MPDPTFHDINTDQLTIKNTDHTAKYHLSQHPSGRIDILLPAGSLHHVYLSFSNNLTNDEAAQLLFDGMLRYTQPGLEHAKRQAKYEKWHEDEMNRLNEEWNERYANILAFRSPPTCETAAYHFGFFFGAMGAIGIGILIGGLLIGR